MKTRRKFSSLIVAKNLLAGILLIALLALTAQPMRAAAAADLTLDWYFIGGSGSSITSGTLALDGTLGQSVSGMPHSNLCSGFGCGLVYWWLLRLPAIYR